MDWWVWVLVGLGVWALFDVVCAILVIWVNKKNDGNLL